MTRGEAQLPNEALTELGKALKDLQDSGGSMPHRDLVRLANLKLPSDLTVDFAAKQSLGYPVVVMRPSGESSLKDVLSPRELEVAQAVAEGLANKQIALRLNIKLATVKDHVHRILEKTGFQNRAEIAAALMTKR